RPLVPRADVVARVVAERAEHLHGDRRARATVAVRHDLGAGGEPERAVDVVGRHLHEPVDVEVARAGDVPLTRIAGLAERAVVLVRRAHVDERDLAEPGPQLLERDLGHRARTTSTSAAIDGRRSSSASHPATRAGNSTPSKSRTRITHGTYATSAQRLCPTSSRSSLPARSFASPRRKA